MKLDLPVYEFVIDDSQEAGVKTISIVDDPAIQSKFIAFEDNKPKLKYFKSEGYEQVVFGLALQPDFPIYRVDEMTGEEYYGVFSKETIKKIVHKFHKELQNNKVNVMHNSKAYIDAYMFSDYIVDSELQLEDLKAKGIPDAKIGSWVVSYKIENPEVFNAVLEGKLNGFSVEAFLEVFVKQIKNNVLNKKIKKEKMKINKSLMEKILSIFAEVEKFTRVLVPELAFEIEYDEVGAPVNKVIINPDGSETLSPVGAGEFATDEGIVVVDEASNLVEVRELPAEPEVEIEVEAPEVPATSGDTEMVISGDTSAPDAQIPPVPEVTGDTETMGANMDACVADLIKQGKTEEEAWAICQSSINGLDSAKMGINKTILEVVGTTDGEYTILVKVKDGVVIEATAQSMQDLMLAKQNEIDALTSKNQELMNRLKEPIGEPILTPEPVVKDFDKMTQYEKLMYKRGLKPV
jgi:hypothetical protein